MSKQPKQSGWTVAGLAKQVGRLQAIPRKEDDRPWKVLGPELERILGREAFNDEHAKAIVDHIIDSCQWCPAPAEIATLARGVTHAKLELLPDPSCPKCEGIGQVVVERNGFAEGARRCDCWARRPTTWLSSAPAAQEREEAGLRRAGGSA